MLRAATLLSCVLSALLSVRGERALAATARFVPAVDRTDAVYDGPRRLVYVSTRSGDVLRYDLDGAAFLPSFALGGELYGMALSPDGNTLVVADKATAAGRSWIHVIALGTGQARRIEFPLDFGELGTYSVDFAAPGIALVTSFFDGSGWVPMRRVDLGTDQAQTIATVRQDTMLARSADGSVVAFAEGNISSGSFGLYDTTAGTFTQSGTGWFTFEIGVSRDGGQVAVPSYNGMYVYDGGLAQLDLIGTYAQTSPIGVAYSPVLDRVYLAWWGPSDSIQAWDTMTLSPVETIDGSITFGWIGNGAFNEGRLRISDDGTVLLATVAGGVNVYENLVTTTTSTTTSTTSTTRPALKHFQCYEVRPPGSFTRGGLVLTDQFGSATVALDRLFSLCAPADKNDEDPTAPAAAGHLAAYGIGPSAPFTRVRGQTVANQFGTLLVDVIRPARLLVPTAKSLGGLPPPLTEPLDHFQCYRIKRARGGPPFLRVADVQIDTQLETGVRVDVARPRRLCVPVDKNGESPDAPGRAGHLVCYRTRSRTSFAGRGVTLQNQLGTESRVVGKRQELCVPSVLGTPPTTTSTASSSTSTTSSTTTTSTLGPRCGDGVRNRPGEACDGGDDAQCPGACLPNCVCGPFCGDNIRTPDLGEECDGFESFACAGLCLPDCTCPPPVCGNNVIEAGEQCDGTAHSSCVGLCGPGCICPPPVCGNNVIEAGEQCDGTQLGICSVFLLDVACSSECGCCGVTEGCPDLPCCDATDQCLQLQGQTEPGECVPTTCAVPEDCRGNRGCEGGACCEMLGAVCRVEQQFFDMPCCSGLECNGFLGQFTFTCCVPGGGGCSSDGDCCSFACDAGTCTSCYASGIPCPGPLPCCNGCSGGTCQ